MIKEKGTSASRSCKKRLVNDKKVQEKREMEMRCEFVGSTNPCY